MFLGNAGTAVRFLTALTATLPGRSTITGDAHMQKRPIRPLVEALQRAGVQITDSDGCPPVTIELKSNSPIQATMGSANFRIR